MDLNNCWLSLSDDEKIVLLRNGFERWLSSSSDYHDISDICEDVVLDYFKNNGIVGIDKKSDIFIISYNDSVKYIRDIAKMSDNELMDKFIGVLSEIHKDGRITEDEFNRLFFYGMYNNANYMRWIYDW